MKRSRGKETEKEIRFLSSGCDRLDLSLGNGYPLGKIVNIVGDKSSGKTLLASELIYKARSVFGDKLKWFYDDVEAGYSFNSKLMYGFTIFDGERDPPSITIEDFAFNLKRKLDSLKEDEFFIYVLDSFDSLSSEAEILRDVAKRKALESGSHTKGDGYKLEKQRFLGEFFRLRAKEIREKNFLLLIISQVREKIGITFGKRQYRTGGKALDHYAAQILWLMEEKKLISCGNVKGVSIRVKVEKNKVDLPFRECSFEILFNYGVDNISSNLNFLYDLDGTDKKNVKLKWEGKVYTKKGLVSYIEKNNLEDILLKKIGDKCEDIEKKTFPNRKSKFDGVGGKL